MMSRGVVCTAFNGEGENTAGEWVVWRVTKVNERLVF